MYHNQLLMLLLMMFCANGASTGNDFKKYTVQTLMQQVYLRGKEFKSLNDAKNWLEENLIHCDIDKCPRKFNYTDKNDRQQIIYHQGTGFDVCDECYNKMYKTHYIEDPETTMTPVKDSELCSNKKFFEKCYYCNRKQLYEITNDLTNCPKLITAIRDGETPLHFVAKCNNSNRNMLDAADILLKAKADPNAKNTLDGPYKDQTPLHYLTRWIYSKDDLYWGNEDRSKSQGSRQELHYAVKKLLDYDADPNIKDATGKTALDLAREAYIQQVDDETIALLENASENPDNERKKTEEVQKERKKREIRERREKEEKKQMMEIKQEAFEKEWPYGVQACSYQNCTKKINTFKSFHDQEWRITRIPKTQRENMGLIEQYHEFKEHYKIRDGKTICFRCSRNELKVMDQPTMDQRYDAEEQLKKLKEEQSSNELMSQLDMSDDQREGLVRNINKTNANIEKLNQIASIDMSIEMVDWEKAKEQQEKLMRWNQE